MPMTIDEIVSSMPPLPKADFIVVEEFSKFLETIPADTRIWERPGRWSNKDYPHTAFRSTVLENHLVKFGIRYRVVKNAELLVS